MATKEQVQKKFKEFAKYMTESYNEKLQCFTDDVDDIHDMLDNIIAELEDN